MTGIARWCLARPGAAVVALVAVTIALAAGLPRLRTDVGYRAFLGQHHPSVERFDGFLERFGGGLPMAAVWRCGEGAPCEAVFDDAALAMTARVAERLARAPGVRAVHTPGNTPVALPTPAGPLPLTAWRDGGPAPLRDALAARALDDPLWRGRLVGPDGRTGAVVVELESSSSETAAAGYAALDGALAPEEERGFEFHRVGGPVEFVVAGGELERATARLIPVMVVLVGLTLWVLFRSVVVAVAVLGSVGISVIWTMGILGWLSRFGWAQNSLTQVLPPLVLVIGVCDGIHLVSSLVARLADRPAGDRAERRRAVEASVADVGAPCLMTTLTTAAGFLAFTTAELESFARFGCLAAVGVLFALLHCFTVLPLVLWRVPPTSLVARRTSRHWDRALGTLVGWTAARSRAVVAASLVVGSLSAVGMARLEVDARFEELYGEDSRVVQWVRFVSAHLRRPDTLEVELTLPADASLGDPASLETIAATARDLAAIDSLGPARSVVDWLSWTHRLVRGDDPAWQRIAATREENEALLAATRLLLAGADGGGGLVRWVTPDWRAVRISLESDKTPQEPLRRAMARVRQRLDEGLPPGWSGRATGPLAVVHDMIDAIRSTQLRSFASAGVAVWGMVAIFLGSMRWALLALVPTALPVVVTLGAMAAAGLALDVGSAMVAAVILGIAVDDTIHLLEHFRRRRRDGQNEGAAMAEAVRHVGRALVTTSLALTLGFAALALSPWKSVASFGLVSAVAIAGALASCLVVLPALVRVLPWPSAASAPGPGP
jgi:predicted RND superfamily exporter protein